DVVAHVVGDHGRVARVVLGNARFDLADEVRADVGRFRVDAAADAGEQAHEARPERETDEGFHRVAESEEQEEHHEETADTKQPNPTTAGPATASPATAPPLKARPRARLRPPRAAWATRTFARTATCMPT